MWTPAGPHLSAGSAKFTNVVLVNVVLVNVVLETVVSGGRCARRPPSIALQLKIGIRRVDLNTGYRPISSHWHEARLPLNRVVWPVDVRNESNRSDSMGKMFDDLSSFCITTSGEACLYWVGGLHRGRRAYS